MQEENVLNKRISWKIIILILILIAGGFWAVNYFGYFGPQVNEFAGNLQGVDGNTLTVRGFYMIDEKDNPSVNPLLDTEVKIKIDSNTEIVKTVYTYPTQEELKDTGGRYDSRDLKKEEKPGSLDELSERIGADIKITSTRNIFNKESFTAKKVNYTVNVYPGLEYTGES